MDPDRPSRTSSGLVLAIAVALTLSSAPGADARTPRLTLQTIAFPATNTGYADGRYVMLPSTDPHATVRVRDDVTGEVKDSGCIGITSLAGGTGVATCPGDGESVSLWSFRSGTITRLPLTSMTANGGFIGLRWFGLNTGPPTSPTDVTQTYFNWHTGERRQASQLTANVDDPDLTAPDRRLSGDVILRRSSPIRLESEALHRRIRIRVGREVRTIRRCPGGYGCQSIIYSHGVVSWVQGGQPFAHRVSTGRTFTAVLPEGYTRLGYLTHTSRRLYLSGDGRGTADYGSGPRQTYAWQAAIPTR